MPAAAQEPFACQSRQIWRGGQQEAHRGFDLSVGNWNGQDLPDILAGGASPLDTPNIVDSVGSIGLYYPTGFPYDQGCVAAEDLRIVGEQDGDRFGWSVAFVGNLELTPGQPGGSLTDEQLRDDFIVGAPRGPFDSVNGWTDQGKVHVFLSGIFDDTIVNPTGADASLIIVDPVPKHRFGYSVCRAADFDSDGWPDFVVGAPGMFEDPAVFGGSVSVISGALVEAAALDFQNGQGPQLVNVDDVVCQWLASPPSPVVWYGDASGDKLGVDVAFVGDLGVR